MKLGLSSYSLNRQIAAGSITLAGAMDFAASHHAQCMELVPFAFRFVDDQTGEMDSAAIQNARKAAKDAGITLCNYSVLADFCREGEALEAEIQRVIRHVEVAAALEIPRMRHDVCGFRRPHGSNTLADFDRWLPVMAEAAARITRRARELGVFTMVENHGFFANGCDRVERILSAVGDDNFGLLLDTGNIVCVDEDAQVAAAALSAKARMVHLKDFYIRTDDPGDSTQFDCEGSWFRSRGGKYLRGAILHQGDLDIPAVLHSLKSSGYDGNIVIEFEGLEDAFYASAVSLDNARRIWDSL